MSRILPFRGHGVKTKVISGTGLSFRKDLIPLVPGTRIDSISQTEQSVNHDISVSSAFSSICETCSLVIGVVMMRLGLTRPNTNTGFIEVPTWSKLTRYWCGFQTFSIVTFIVISKVNNSRVKIVLPRFKT